MPNDILAVPSPARHEPTTRSNEIETQMKGESHNFYLNPGIRSLKLNQLNIQLSSPYTIYFFQLFYHSTAVTSLIVVLFIFINH